MGIIARTFTRGFRTSFFRNQPVHQFYGHLQAVLKEIAPGGELDHLFARPEFSSDGQSLPEEIEWSTSLEGEMVMFKDLSPEKQRNVADQIGRSFEKIRKYAEEKQARSQKEKDYAEYLRSVAVSPDLNQIFLVKGQPVLVHWGLICEDGRHPGQGLYSGWDEFIARIQRKAGGVSDEQPEKVEKPVVQPIILPPEPPPEIESVPEKPKAEKVTAAQNAAPAAPIVKEKAAPKPETKPAPEEKKPKRILACGLGDYEWVKWLAIILAIIILLLLLLRLIPPAQPAFPQMPPGMSMGGGGSGGGGSGSGGSGSGGSGGGAGSGSGSGGQMPAPGSPCPTCGHQVPAAQPPVTQPQSGHNHGGNGAVPAPVDEPSAEAVKTGDNQ